MTFNKAHTYTKVGFISLISLVNGFPISSRTTSITTTTIIDNETTTIDMHFVDSGSVDDDYMEINTTTSTYDINYSDSIMLVSNSDDFYMDVNYTNSTDDTNVNKRYRGSIVSLVVFGVLICGVPAGILLWCCFNRIANCCSQICDDYKVGRDHRTRNRLNRPRIVMRTKLEKFDKKNAQFGSECNICISTDKTKHMVTLPCKHAFHKKCVQPWIRQEAMDGNSPVCPTCRAHIYDELELSKIRGTYVTNPVWSGHDSDSDDDWRVDEY
jgi:hypothetical protein